eukprot:1059016-Rhodomonas_salina.2
MQIDSSEYTTAVLSVKQCKHDTDLGPAVDSASPFDIQTDPAFKFDTLTAEPKVRFASKATSPTSHLQRTHILCRRVRRVQFAFARTTSAVYSNLAMCQHASGRSRFCTFAEPTTIGLGPTHCSHGKRCSSPTSRSTLNATCIPGDAMSWKNCPKSTLSSALLTEALRAFSWDGTTPRQQRGCIAFASSASCECRT